MHIPKSSENKIWMVDQRKERNPIISQINKETFVLVTDREIKPWCKKNARFII
jgi:hypothetical protein